MEAVQDQVIDVLLGRCPVPAASDRASRARLLAQGRAFLALAERHPRVFVMAAARRWKTPAAFALVQAALDAFAAAGARPRQALQRARILGAYLGGAGAALAGWALDTGAIDATRGEDLERVAPRLLAASNRAAVRRDLDRGIVLLVDRLLADLTDGESPIRIR
jgi:hypothetical protein